jgi:ferredoxin-NADP reductase
MTAMSLVRRVRVAGCEEIAEGIRHIVLVPLDGGTLPEWTPGAHIDVVLPSGLVRQYSLCGSPRNLDRYDIAVLREPHGRGGSAEIHDELMPGDEISFAGPRNRFPLEAAKSYVFVAGGIGITPLLPMIEEVDEQGLPWRLVYGGRSLRTMAFLDRLGAFPDRVEVLPQDAFGLLDLERLLVPEPDALVYCCGPEPLLEAVEARCSRGWHEEALHVERFTAGQSAPQLLSGEKSFEVQLGDGGPVVEVPADQSILQTLLDHGVDALYSCEEGTCGSCETQVISGSADHRDSLLSDASKEMGCMLICVSRSCGPRLVLDVEAPPELQARTLPKQDSA